VTPYWTSLWGRLRYRRLWRSVFHRCEECGKPIWFSRDPFCSDKCFFADNLPF